MVKIGSAVTFGFFTVECRLAKTSPVCMPCAAEHRAPSRRGAAHTAVVPSAVWAAIILIRATDLSSDPPGALW